MLGTAESRALARADVRARQPGPSGELSSAPCLGVARDAELVAFGVSEGLRAGHGRAAGEGPARGAGSLRAQRQVTQALIRTRSTSPDDDAIVSELEVAIAGLANAGHVVWEAHAHEDLGRWHLARGREAEAF